MRPISRISRRLLRVNRRRKNRARPEMNDFGNQFGINTYSYTQTMTAADCLRHLADKGARAFELMFFPGHLWITDSPETLAEIRNVVSASELRLMSVNSPNIDLNVAAATEEMRDLSLQKNKGFLRVAGELGAEGLILGPGKANPLFPLPTATLEGYFFRALDQLVPEAEKYGVRLFVENMPFAFLPAAGEVMDVLSRYGNGSIEVCYDVANGHFTGEDPNDGLRTVSSRLGVVHVSDTGRSVYRHDAVGKGEIDFSRIPAAIAETGYDKPVLLEIISDRPDSDIATSIAALRQAGFE